MSNKGTSITADTGSITLTGSDITFHVHTPLPDDHPFYGLIGRVASEWSHLEHVLDLIIWELAGVDPVRGASITAQIMGATNRYQSILALATTRGISQKTVKRITNLEKDMQYRQNARNRIIHDAWYIESDNEKPAQFRSMPKNMPKNTRKYGFYDITEDYMKETIKGIIAIVENVHSLRSDILSELQS